MPCTGQSSGSGSSWPRIFSTTTYSGRASGEARFSLARRNSSRRRGLDGRPGVGRRGRQLPRFRSWRRASCRNRFSCSWLQVAARDRTGRRDGRSAAPCTMPRSSSSNTRRVRAFEDLAMLHLDRGQLVDVEEAAIVDFVGRDPPVGQAIRLLADAAASSRSKLRASPRVPLSCCRLASIAAATAGELVDQLLQAPLDDFLLAVLFGDPLPVGHRSRRQVADRRQDAEELQQVRHARRRAAAPAARSRSPRTGAYEPRRSGIAPVVAVQPESAVLQLHGQAGRLPAPCRTDRPARAAESCGPGPA